jgi:streptomycin 6-kinase
VVPQPTAFPVPERLAAYSADRGDWLAELPDVVAGLARRWSLAVGAPFEPGGECAWVAPVVSATDGDVVLKVGWTHDEARDEAAGLRVWDGYGAVRLLDAFAAGETSALLLEPATPGTPLSLLDGPEQDRVLAGLLRRLWVDPGADHPFRPLHVMCDAWIEEARPGLGHLDPGLVRDGLALSATSRGMRPTRSCWPRTCTRRTCSPPAGSRGSSSTRSPTSVIPPTTWCSTC